MAKPKLSLRARKDGELASFAHSVLNQIEGDPNFPNPTPPLAEVEAVLQEYEEAYAHLYQVQNAARLATTQKRQCRKRLESKLSQLAAYIGIASNGSKAVINAAGLSAADGGSPVGRLQAPENLSARVGAFEGEVVLRWRAQSRARIYEVEFKLDGPGDDWQRSAPVTRSRASVRDLTPGVRYRFRVRSLTTAGPSPYSDPAFCRAG